MAEEAEFAARLAVTWCSCAGAADKAARAMHLAAKAQVSMLDAAHADMLALQNSGLYPNPRPREFSNQLGGEVLHIQK
eukprot:6215946-Amphidinium_carterae.1